MEAPDDPLAGTITLDRGTHPWSGLTTSAQEESAGHHVQAVHPFPSGYAAIPALAAFDRPEDPLLALNPKERRVLANAAWFTDIERVDATRHHGADLRICAWKDLGFQRLALRELILFLLKANIVQTFWHVEANISLESEKTEGAMRSFTFKGEHLYFTNERNRSGLHFRLRLDTASGEIFLCEP